MTKEEFEKVPFKMTSHVSMVHQHTITYANRQYGFVLVCSTAVKKDGFEFGKTKRTFIYDGKKYNSLDAFLEAVKDVEYINQ